MSVQSPLVALKSGGHGEEPRSVMSVKVRKGGGFFYGNKGNENYT